MKKKIWKKNGREDSPVAPSLPKYDCPEDAWKRHLQGGSGDENPTESMTPRASEACPHVVSDRALQGLETGGLYSQFIDLLTKSIKMAFVNTEDLDASQTYRVVANQTQITQKLIDFLEAQETEVLELLFPGHRDQAKAVDPGPNFLDSSSTNFLASLESEPVHPLLRPKHALTTQSDAHAHLIVSEAGDEGDLDPRLDHENELYLLMGVEKTHVGLPMSPVRKWSAGSADAELLFGLKEVAVDRRLPFFREPFFEHGGQQPSIGDAMDDS